MTHKILVFITVLATCFVCGCTSLKQAHEPQAAETLAPERVAELADYEASLTAEERSFLTHDLSMVPQYVETEEEREERMQWFRDAKFGLFIHWGPSSVGQAEIGWGRRANQPFDVRKDRHGPRGTDAEYDNWYKEFNPVKFDAEEWVKFAIDAGMKYIVMVSKHHDGFSMFDSKVTEYDIMSTPFERDIIGEMIAACQKYDMPIGLYYSQRDWYHPNYLLDGNKAYDEWYLEQIRELVTNYGDIDILWFDHIGGGKAWDRWDFAKLFNILYTNQPDLIVNDRAAKNVAGYTERGRVIPQPSDRFKKMTKGDFTTRESVIGGQDLGGDWESCIHSGFGWSYRGEEIQKTPRDGVQMLVSTATGGGNLLLNFGPRPDGSFTTGEAEIAREMGKWLKRNGAGVYGTHGGPYNNGGWGGTTFKGNKLFVHITSFPFGGMALDGIDNKIISARTLTRHEVEFSQSADEILLNVAPEDRDEYATVIELTMENPVELTPMGEPQPGARVSEVIEDLRGSLLSADIQLIATGSTVDQVASLDIPSIAPIKPASRGLKTPKGKSCWAVVDLGAVKNVSLLEIQNYRGRGLTSKMDIFASVDGKAWEKIHTTVAPEELWRVPVTRFQSGIYLPGRDVRYFKFVRDNAVSKKQRELVLQKIEAYGQAEK